MTTARQTDAGIDPGGMKVRVQPKRIFQAEQRRLRVTPMLEGAQTKLVMRPVVVRMSLDFANACLVIALQLFLALLDALLRVAEMMNDKRSFGDPEL